MNILHLEEKVFTDSQNAGLELRWVKFRGGEAPKIARVVRVKKGGAEIFETETQFLVRGGRVIVLHEFLEGGFTKFVRVEDSGEVRTFPTYYAAEEYVAGRMNGATD